ncbi:MAG: WYL domain-containing protein [Bacteroidota bacterium]
MRTYFDAEIRYDSSKRGYYYANAFSLQTVAPLTNQELDLLELLSNINQFQNLPIFKDIFSVFEKVERAVNFNLSRNKNKEDFIQFEDAPYFQGGEYIDFFFRAIKAQKVVLFDYQKFHEAQPRRRTLEPYLLKEHKNRWYIIGYEPSSELFKAFGLDRVISSPAPEWGASFTRNSSFDPARLMSNSMGLYINNDDPLEEIILSFTPYQAKYFKSQPFYAYQKEDVLLDNEEGFQIKLRLVIHEELIMELARLGAGVEVLAPFHLREKLKEYHQNALKKKSIYSPPWK